MPLKFQDIGFLAILVGLLFLRNTKLISLMGIICLILAMPLFAFWVFFTAQRLIIYATVFFLLSTILQIVKARRNT